MSLAHRDTSAISLSQATTYLRIARAIFEHNRKIAGASIQRLSLIGRHYLNGRKSVNWRDWLLATARRASRFAHLARNRTNSFKSIETLRSLSLFNYIPIFLLIFHFIWIDVAGLDHTHPLYTYVMLWILACTLRTRIYWLR